MDKQDVIDALMSKLKSLSESIWDRQHSMPHIQSWVDQFTQHDAITDDEQIHALYLLSNFTYFGQLEIRNLLISLYRDQFRGPLLRDLRRQNNDTTDADFLDQEFRTKLSQTRFLGVGNPSESGVHLLYYFRQENDLPKSLFINTHQIFSPDPDDSRKRVLREPDIEHYVFIDDLCGSGTQAEEYSDDLIEPLRDLNPDTKIHYLVLFATDVGLQAVRDLGRYDYVSCVYELDSSFKSLDPSSRIFGEDTEHFDRIKVRTTCQRKGRLLWPTHPLGYKDGQLLLGFSHNTPDNTLPIFWCEMSAPNPWKPMFKRYHKDYG